MTRDGGPPRVSVVVPFRNEESHIAEQLLALSSQRADFTWELILVDNGSTDGGRAIAEDFRTVVPEMIIVEETSKPGAAAARNRGVREARAGYLLFCDADDVVADGWLTAMKMALDDNPLVCGEIDLDRLNTNSLKATRPFQRTKELGGATGFLPAAGAGNLGVHRWLYDEVGGFDDEFRALEDVDFVYKAQLSGAELTMTHDSLVHYRFRSGLGAIYRQAVRFGIAGVRIRLRFVPLGMPERSWKSTTHRWLRLMLTAHHLLSQERRARWTFQAGHLSGIVIGSIRYGLLR